MSIAAGLDSLIDRALGIEESGKPKRYATLTGQRKVQAVDGYALFDAMVAHLDAAHARSSRDVPSGENWRFVKKPYISANNASKEKTLEKRITNLLDASWVNQVPTASGLWDGTADTHRNIDLVHRPEPGVYEFIELKVESDTPFSAAVEVLIYAAFYVIARRVYRSPRPEMLQAREVRLRVLAPAAFYGSRDVTGLEVALDTGLRAWSRNKTPDLAMSFAFTVFPEDFRWPGAEDQGLLAAMAAREPVGSLLRGR